MNVAIALFLIAVMFRTARVVLVSGHSTGSVAASARSEARKIRVALGAVSALCGVAAVTALA